MASKLFQKAAQAVKKRNYDYAIELFIQELTRNPNNAEARRALRAAELKKFQEAGIEPNGGTAYLKGLGALLNVTFHKLTKDYERAMLDCEQFLRHAPRNKGILRSLGEVSRLAGHGEAAKVAFEELLEEDRQSQPALRALAQIHREEDDIAQALLYYERLKKVNPSDGEAAKAVRDLAAATASQRVEDRRATGDGTFRDIVKDKDGARRLETAGKRARSAAEVDEQIALLTRDLDGSTEDARRHKKIGDLHLRRKDWGQAIQAYEKGLEVKHDPLLQDALGDAKLKRVDHALQQLGLKAKKGDAAAAAKAKKLQKQRTKLGIDEYERRVKARPTELTLRFQLGTQLYKAKRFDDAIVHLQKAAGDARRGTQARSFLGKCFAAKGMIDLAVKEFRKALERSPGLDEAGKEIAYSLACVLEKAGKKEEAAAEFERIIEVDIEYRDAMKRLETLKS